MREIQIHEKFYDARISFLLGGFIGDVETLLKRRHGPERKTGNQGDYDTEPLANDTDGLQFSVPGELGKDERFYVWIHKPSLNLISHETLHLVFDILVTRGIAYEDSCEDAFAYLYGNIFEELCNKLRITLDI